MEAGLPWQLILDAPTLGLRLTDSEVEVIEEDGFDRGFQIMEPPAAARTLSW